MWFSSLPLIGSRFLFSYNISGLQFPLLLLLPVPPHLLSYRDLLSFCLSLERNKLLKETTKHDKIRYKIVVQLHNVLLIHRQRSFFLQQIGTNTGTTSRHYGERSWNTQLYIRCHHQIRVLGTPQPEGIEDLRR